MTDSYKIRVYRFSGNYWNEDRGIEIFEELL